MEIQNKYKGGIPFGYRKYTDETFLSRDAMLGTVKHMLDLGDLPDKQKGRILRVNEHFLDLIKCRENEFIGSKYLDMAIGDGNLDRFILFNLLIHGDDDFFSFLGKNGINQKTACLLQLCDGWFPLDETKDIFVKSEGFGTDMGSNNVATLGCFNPEIHRILENDKIEKILGEAE